MADFTKLSDEELLKRYGKLPGKSKPKRNTPTGPGPVDTFLKDWGGKIGGAVLEGLQMQHETEQKIYQGVKKDLTWKPDRVQQPTVKQLMRASMKRSQQGSAERKRRERLSPEEAQNERRERALNTVVNPNVNTPVSVNSDDRGKTEGLSSTYGSLGKPDPNSPFALENNPWGLVDSSKTPNQPLNKQTPKPVVTDNRSEPDESIVKPKVNRRGRVVNQKEITQALTKPKPKPKPAETGWSTVFDTVDADGNPQVLTRNQRKAWERANPKANPKWDEAYTPKSQVKQTPQKIIEKKVNTDEIKKNIEETKDATKKTSIENIGASLLNQTKVGQVANKINQVKDIITSLKTVGAAKTASTMVAGIDPVTIALSLAINAAKQSAQGTGASSGTGYREIDKGQEYDEWNWA